MFYYEIEECLNIGLDNPGYAVLILQNSKEYDAKQFKEQCALAINKLHPLILKNKQLKYTTEHMLTCSLLAQYLVDNLGYEYTERTIKGKYEIDEVED